MLMLFLKITGKAMAVSLSLLTAVGLIFWVSTMISDKRRYGEVYPREAFALFFEGMAKTYLQVIISIPIIVIMCLKITH